VSRTLVTEFQWSIDGAANGASGEGLADALIRLVQRLDGVRSVCDLGCGNGYICGRLNALGYEVTGVDASISGLEIAQRNHPRVRFIHAMIDRRLIDRVGSAAFDLIISSDVIEHLYRPADLLEAALPLMKPNGQIIVGTPYHGYLKNLVLSLTGKMDAHFSVLHDGGHIKFFSVKTLSELMTSHSFQHLNFTFYGRSPWLWKNMICHAKKQTDVS
jgi:2-polyprenyl-3-methyl-5-hydroxy-6-metoxy-1,4-benzoquinol methylase